MESSSKYWKNLSTKITSAGQTKNKRPNTADVECEFLKDYLSIDDDLLDIGSGTGLIINKLLDKVKHITAVEKFEGFTKFITEAPNMLVINAELEGFKMRKEFDVILCTGVAQCFTRDQMLIIYKDMFDMLKSDKNLIVRMHCGLLEDITVNGFSEELGTDYFASYRQVDSEIALLKQIGFKSVEKFDFLPDSINVWDNSRHFYFICKK